MALPAARARSCPRPGTAAAHHSAMHVPLAPWRLAWHAAPHFPTQPATSPPLCMQLHQLHPQLRRLDPRRQLRLRVRVRGCPLGFPRPDANSERQRGAASTAVPGAPNGTSDAPAPCPPPASHAGGCSVPVEELFLMPAANHTKPWYSLDYGGQPQGSYQPQRLPATCLTSTLTHTSTCLTSATCNLSHPLLATALLSIRRSRAHPGPQLRAGHGARQRAVGLCGGRPGGRGPRPHAVCGHAVAPPHVLCRTSRQQRLSVG